MEIKICGITNLKDALCACSAGADAIGFIFYKKSPRYVAPETVRSIVRELPHTLCRVGVFVNHDPKEVDHIFDFCGLTMIQLHGDETPQYCRHFSGDIVIKAASPGTAADIEKLREFPAKAILVDARDTGFYGGTGKKSNWKLAAILSETHPVILSGGLNAKNVEEACNAVSPRAVDVNSGVETSPGMKDHEKLKHIINEVRGMDRHFNCKIFLQHIPVTRLNPNPWPVKQGEV
jgi:phosphoribosylanthranilate isomerase